MTKTNKQGRRFQFGLRLLLLAMTLVVAICAWLTQKSENRAVTAIKRYGGYARRAGGTRGRELWAVHLRSGAGDGVLYYVRTLEQVSRLGLDGTGVTDEGLSRLSGLTCRVLQLGGTNISDAGLANLRTLRGLETLALNDVPSITDAGLEHLKHHAALQNLDLSGTKVTGAGLRFLSELDNLRVLSLRNTRATDQSLGDLRGLVGLETLDVSGTAITGTAFEPLQAELQTVRYLNLNRTQLNDTGMAWVARMPRLEVLEVADTQITDAGLSHLQQVGSLRDLILDNTRIRGHGLIHLNSSTALSMLHLNGTQVGDEGLAHLRPLTKMESLELDGTPITDVGLGHLGSLSGLRSLHINRLLHVSADAIVRLRQKMPATHIESKAVPFDEQLSVSERPIAEKLYGHSAGLDYCQAADGPILTVLPYRPRTSHYSTWYFTEEVKTLLSDLTDQLGYSADSFEHPRQPIEGTNLFDNLRRLPNLRWLYLPHGKRSKVSYVRISELSNLHTLYLNHSAIDDEDLAHIANMPALRELHLDHCEYVTDAGIAALQRCPQLSKLYISGTQVSSSVRSELNSRSMVQVRWMDPHGKWSQWTVPRDARFELLLKGQADSDDPRADHHHKSIHWDHRTVRIRDWRGTGSGSVYPRGRQHRLPVQSFLLVTPDSDIAFETPPRSHIVIQHGDSPIIRIDVVAD